MDEHQQSVLDLLKGHPGGLLMSRIARELGLRRGGDRRLKRLVLRMHEEGILHRHRGRFLLPEKGEVIRRRRRRYDETPIPLESTETERARGMEALLAEYEIPVSFSDKLLEEADSQAERDPFARGNRRDLRGLSVFCIDPADARDHDDALSLENLPGGGWRLGVHIADVAQYVQPGGLLDSEARRRGNSTYFFIDTIPMLPHRLSADLCSLREGALRPALSVFLDFDAEGRSAGREICESRLVVSRSFSYEEAEAALDQPGEDGDLMRGLLDLADRLRKARGEEGAIQFDLAERVPLEEEGEVVGFGPVKILRSHGIVEECMLAANREVCRFLLEKEARPIFRIHEHPDEEDVQKLSALIERSGLSWRPGLPPKSSDYRELAARLGSLDVALRERLLFAMLRSMKRAAYSPVHAGHFGLAWRDYLHFTSPIRRYADLLVHRQVKAILRGGRRAPMGDLEEIGRELTEAESRSMLAEREGKNLEMVLWARRHRGETFEARVRAVFSGGLLVRLPASGVESFLPAFLLGSEWFEYDEENERLRGERTGKRYEAGDRLILKIAEANYLSRRINFSLEENGDASEYEHSTGN